MGRDKRQHARKRVNKPPSEEKVAMEQKNYALDALNASIGAAHIIERNVRFQLARLLIRWYELVWKGEEQQTDTAIQMRSRLDGFFRGAEKVEDKLKNVL